MSAIYYSQDIIVGFLREVFKGGGNWGTLRIPREDWGTLGNIREDQRNHHPHIRILLHQYIRFSVHTWIFLLSVKIFLPTHQKQNDKKADDCCLLHIPGRSRCK